MFPVEDFGCFFVTVENLENSGKTKRERRESGARVVKQAHPKACVRAKAENTK